MYVQKHTTKYTSIKIDAFHLNHSSKVKKTQQLCSLMCITYENHLEFKISHSQIIIICTATEFMG